MGLVKDPSLSQRRSHGRLLTLELVHEHMLPTLERYLKLRSEEGHAAAH